MGAAIFVCLILLLAVMRGGAFAMFLGAVLALATGHVAWAIVLALLCIAFSKHE